MADFLECFSAEPDDTASHEFEILKIAEQPRIVAVFTQECEELPVHYLDSSDHRGYVQCLLPKVGKCLLCDTSRTQEVRIVLPVYDVESDSVVAMLISDTRSPHSLGPQVRAEMAKGGLDRRYLVISRRFAKYEVKSAPMPPGAESGEAAIAEFLQKLKEGKVALANAIPKLANSELAAIPEIHRKATALGLKWENYCSAETPAVAAHE